MNVELAKTAGFCFGVKRAVDTVYKQIEKHQSEKIFTYGPIIHNEEVIKDLRSHGVEVLNDEEELKTVDADVVVIRSHGVAKYIYDIMDERGITCVDATCPFVKKIHKIVAEESAKGSYIVIIGNGEHPEVEGIRGWAGEQVTVIQTPEDAERFELPEKEQKVCIVAQTTFNYNKFKELVEIISKKRYDIVVLNTICNATKERQTEARQIAARVDAMVVIGDKRSSNTQKLFEICKEECLNTYYIQTLDDLDINQLRSVESVGITAGSKNQSHLPRRVTTKVSSPSAETCSFETSPEERTSS